jgi:hypothetical protein
MRSDELVYESFWPVRHRIADADVLLWRRRSLISIAGRGDHSHASMAGWWDDHLMNLEIREWIGGNAKTLSSQVARHPGRIDVFGLVGATLEQRQIILDAMKGKTGHDYNYRGILLVSLLHLPGMRLLARPDTSDSCSREPEQRLGPEFCSQAVDDACRRGLFRLVRNLANRITEPADLARSARLAYKFTLIP